MKNRHITKFIDTASFGDLSTQQIAEINLHIVDCADCHSAFQSARIASLLLKENPLSDMPVSSPFFQTKVLYAWREKQLVQKPIAVFWRWWQASATLVLMMFLTVIGLLTANYIGLHSEYADNQAFNSDITLYSPETIILNQKPSRNLTAGQVFEVLDDDK